MTRFFTKYLETYCLIPPVTYYLSPEENPRRVRPHEVIKGDSRPICHYIIHITNIKVPPTDQNATTKADDRTPRG